MGWAKPSLILGLVFKNYPDHSLFVFWKFFKIRFAFLNMQKIRTGWKAVLHTQEPLSNGYESHRTSVTCLVQISSSQRLKVKEGKGCSNRGKNCYYGMSTSSLKWLCSATKRRNSGFFLKKQMLFLLLSFLMVLFNNLCVCVCLYSNFLKKCSTWGLLSILERSTKYKYIAIFKM